MESSTPTTIIAKSKRRNFLKKIFTGAATTMVLPGFENFAKNQTPPIPKPNFAEAPDERYWELIKKQFTVPSDLIMVNAANLCPSPYFIQDKVIEHIKKLGRDVSFQSREIYTQKRDDTLVSLAQFIKASRDEVTITRNTSESNSFIVNGLDFRSGDEIVLWDQNHPTNGLAWEHRSKRYGFSVKKVSVPSMPKSKEDLINSFTKAFSSKTRLVSFSHISNTSGINLPAKELCAIAKEKGILTLVDGAQSFGMMDMNVKALGCDFYTASTHKWLMGPFENGILYVNKEKFGRVWPTLVGAGWKDDQQTADYKFATLGQRNEATTIALQDILEFHNSIGKKNIEERVIQLASHLKEKIQGKIPHAKFISPLTKGLSAGIVIIDLPGKLSKDIFQKLYELHGIACASTGGIRFSPHVYNTLSDMEKIAEALASLST